VNPRALIAEDEPLLADALRAELAQLWPELEVVTMARNGNDALAALQSERPDIAFLDIRMPGLTGLEVAQAVAEDWPADAVPPLIVFVTAFDEFAVAAFEQAAVDYVLKPVQRDRLRRAIERLKTRLAERPGDAMLESLALQLRSVLGTSAGATSGALASPLRTIRAGVGETVRMIPVDTVVYLQATDKYVNVVTATGEALIRESLRDLLPRLDPELFAQIHRSTVVNLDFVTAAVRDDQGRMMLQLRGRPEKLAVSRLYSHLFKAM
jgi:DNA-binding LytR/AlgR family response regulator